MSSFGLKSHCRRGLTRLGALVLASGLAHGAFATECAYVTDGWAHRISIIDIATRRLTHTIRNIGGGRSHIAIAPSRNLAFLASANLILVLNLASYDVVDILSGGSAFLADAIAVSPDDSTVYFSSTNRLTAYDIATRQITAIVDVALGAGDLAVGRDGAVAYVVNLHPIFGNIPNRVTVIDLFNLSLFATIPVGSGPWNIALSRDGSNAYVTNLTDGTVSRIDTATNRVTATIPVPAFGIAVAPAGDRVFVTQPAPQEPDSQGTVAVIDTDTNSLAATIELGVGAEPERIAFTADGTAAYVTDAGADTVSVIDTTTNTVTDHIDLGNCPYGGCNPSDIAIASP